MSKQRGSRSLAWWAGRQASCRCPAPPRHGLWRRHLLMPCHRALSWPGDVLFVHCLSRSSKGSPVPAVRRVHPDGEQEPKKTSPEMLPREHTSPWHGALRWCHSVYNLHLLIHQLFYLLIFECPQPTFKSIYYWARYLSLIHPSILAPSRHRGSSVPKVSPLFSKEKKVSPLGLNTRSTYIKLGRFACWASDERYSINIPIFLFVEVGIARLSFPPYQQNEKHKTPS
jgi:hypothetical protein